MKCQVHKKDDTRCDKDSVITHEDIHMCKQHHKTFMKNKIHQYGTCLDKKSTVCITTIKEYLFSHKIPINHLDS